MGVEIILSSYCTQLMLILLTLVLIIINGLYIHLHKFVNVDNLAILTLPNLVEKLENAKRKIRKLQ